MKNKGVWNRVVANFRFKPQNDNPFSFDVYLNGQITSILQSASFRIPTITSPVISFCGKGQLANPSVISDAATMDISDFILILGVGALYPESSGIPIIYFTTFFCFGNVTNSVINYFPFC